MTAPNTCLFCDRRPTLVGLWVLSEPYARRFGAPPGKQRVVVYALCRKCQRQPGYLKRVEAKITGEAEMLLAVPANN
jgi:hypothetical protein